MQKGNQAKPGLFPLLSEHGGSFMDQEAQEVYDVRREVEHACRLLGGRWQVKNLPDGSVKMKRLEQDQQENA